MEMRSFQHVTPPLRIFAGASCLDMIDRELNRLNSRRAVIFCPVSMSRNEKAMELIRSAMGDRCAGVFSGVRAHSPASAVEEGAEELKRLDADAVIAVGGGSAVVTARAATILCAEGGNLRSLCTSQDAAGRLNSPRLLAAKLPQFGLPTTPNSAIAKAGSAISDPSDGSRLALFDPKTRVQSVFIHPEFIGSAPTSLLVSAGLDTLSLAVEGLMTQKGDSLADALLIHAVRLLTTNLATPALVDDSQVRSDLVMAAIMCGQGTDQTGAGIATVLGHAIGGAAHVDNGISKTIVLPYGLRFNEAVSGPGLAKLASALGVRIDAPAKPAAPVIEALEVLFATLSLPRRLRDVGISQDSLPGIAAKGMLDWFLRGNPRPVSDASELRQLLEQAW